MFSLSVQGAVYFYNGYEFFPPKAPVYWIPLGGVEGNPLVLLGNGLSFLVDRPFRIVAKSRFYREITIATYDGSPPSPLTSSGTVDPATGQVQPGGGSFYIPAITANYTIQAISYYSATGMISPTATKWILINVGAFSGGVALQRLRASVRTCTGWLTCLRCLRSSAWLLLDQQSPATVRRLELLLSRRAG